ncbi:MAG: general secretion pathway protein GspC [Leptospiraceae bacterium]|nr:general secretion pathway protein GspC [Leptospiraceae bacterium]
MNSFFLKLHKYKFYLLVPLVLLLSYSLAYVVRSGIVLLLPQVGQNKVVRNSAVAIQQTPPKAVNLYEETVVGNMIRGIIPSSPEEGGNGDAGTGSQAAALTEEVPGADEYLVTGTLSGSRSFARTTMKAKGKDEGTEYAIGEKVVGYEVKGIFNHYIVLFKNGVHLKVEIDETIGDAKKKLNEKKPEVEDAAGDPNPDGCPVTKRMISRTDFDRTLKDPNAIYKGARFGPHLVNGKITGYKIASVQTNHIFYTLGARNGDVVKRVNGMPLEKTEKMLEMWSAIKNASKVIVDLDRKGKCLSYEFNITN